MRISIAEYSASSLCMEVGGRLLGTRLEHVQQRKGCGICEQYSPAIPFLSFVGPCKGRRVLFVFTSHHSLPDTHHGHLSSPKASPIVYWTGFVSRCLVVFMR